MMAIKLPEILVDAPIWWRIVEMAIFMSVAFFLGFRAGRGGRREIKGNIPVGNTIPSREELFTDESSPWPSTETEIETPPEIIPEKSSETIIAEAFISSDEADDLTKIDGIGPKLALILKQNGIASFEELSATSSLTLRKILDNEGPQFKVHDPTYWPRQAALAKTGNWGELKTLQSDLPK